MKKTKRIILTSIVGFILLVSFQIFSSGHGHVVVVGKNVELNKVNKDLTNKNQKLTKNVHQLTKQNETLIEEKENLKQMVSKVIGDLDSTRNVVKDIKKELAHEKDIIRKQSTGKQFDFEPIKLPTEDGD